MLNSKYSNILTMVLVVLIVGIIGIIGYFGYDLLHTKKVNTDAQDTLDEFSRAIERETVQDTDNSNTLENVTNPLDLLGEAQPKETEEETEPEKVYMEGYEVKGRIQIPRTKVDYPILETVTKKTLEIAVGIAYTTAENDQYPLNEPGNTVIYGHNFRNGLFFSDNKKLQNGDKVLITDVKNRTTTYIIYNIYQTDANDASFFTRDTEGRREISLQTCTDDSKARIIIWAAEEGTVQP